MGDNIQKTSQHVDLNINSEPYQYNIAPGKDKMFLRALCDALDVGVSILDENLDYQFISHSVFRDLELRNDELKVGDNLNKCHDLMIEKGLLTPKLLEENKLSAQEQLAHAESHEENLPIIVKLGDGSTHKFIRKTLPNGYTVSMSHNVTELVEKDRILEEALALGNSGYWTYDFATKKYYLSQSLRQYFSKEDREKIKTQGIIAIVHPEDRHLFRDALKALSKTNDTFMVTCRSNTYKGNERWSQTTGQVIRGQDGRPKRMRAFVKDVTRNRRQAQELERAKDEAIAASRAKSEFLANMSHEIRTPMNGILGMAELLANSSVDDRQREFINVINNSASALLTIINDILDFSKIEAGAFEMDPMPFDLKTTINDVTAILTPHASEKDLELIINYPPSLNRHFIGDEGRMRQVMTNLIGNAIKFTDEGHIITDVKISEPRDGTAFVTISVKDTGIGIEPNKIDHVFNKFTQADGSTTRVYGGTGLGLSISKAIVEMMNGRMTAQSELGKGSTFTVQIPMPIDVDAMERIYDTSILSGKRALIVDDIHVNRQLLMEQLASWDIKSDAVKGGIEAITQLKNNASQDQSYDLIILDNLMPGMNGKELATIISENEDLPNTPIIMVSSCDQPVSSSELKKIGIESYIVKPVRESRLYNIIVEILSKSKDSNLDIPKPQTPESSPTAETQRAKTEVLVAEDFPLNRDVIRLMLADTIYKPIFVENGLEAVEIHRENPNRFPVIIMDVSMPVMDGHEAASLIKAFEKSRDITPIPIIALTGHALKNDREECLKAGMCDYLSKPVKQAELLEKLNHWLGQDTNDATKASA